MIPMLFVLAAATQAPQPVCVRMEPVAGFQNWGHPAGSALAIGSEATLALKPATGVAFKPALARPAKEGTFGGYFPIDIKQAGRYRIALSQGAWIDLVQKGTRLKSADHAHGPACSGIAKIVAFDLQPGRYWLQLSEAKQASVSAMMVPDTMIHLDGGALNQRKYRKPTS
ncbi:MAG: hypothetical protein JF628_10520 [Sphingomonas sp.]|nr:hypothetical protein [Sphingomonas sp.]